MADGRYEFQVITDWTQPERAIQEYVSRAIAAINQIESQAAATRTAPGTPAAAA